VPSRSKCAREKISTLTPNCIPKENRGQKKIVKEGGGGGLWEESRDVVGGPQKLRSKQKCFHFFFPFFFFLSKFEKLGQTGLLFKQQQQAVDTFRHCLQEERK